MLFYKVTGMLPEEETDQETDYRNERRRVLRIMRAAAEFNEQKNPKTYCFVSDIDGPEVTCGIAAFQKADISTLAETFLKHCSISVSGIKISEITFASWRSLLLSADRCNYIEDDDCILETLGLIGLDRRNPAFDFSKYMIGKTAGYDPAKVKAKELMAGETLIPELDRIYRGSRMEAFGHPVHYIIAADAQEVKKDLLSVLLTALFENGRIRSRRYCCADIDPTHTLGMVYDRLYRSCCGGAVVVNCPGVDAGEEDDHADSTHDTMETLCKTMLKYRHQVLTVFCLPGECEKMKKILFENLGSVSMVEIREDLADHRRSCVYLNDLCKSRNIDPDENLTGALETDRQYLPDELRTIFDEWYNRKLKTAVFPQYRDIAGCRKEAVMDTAKGNAWDELHEMTGLASAKRVIARALNYYKLQRLYKGKGLRQDRPAMHMVFTGNPGTAKTTVARLFARIMRENGLLSKGHLVEVGRGDLVGKYVGWTAQTVQGKFRAASGGVLFIDEAYSLVDDRGGSFGDEAINTIVQEMESHREDLVVIFAGYPDEMERFLNRNPGLRSRIAFHVPFEDYSTEELCSIAKLIGRSKGIRLSDSALERLAGIFDDARKQQDFGNGRFVRSIIELSRMNQAERILLMDPDAVTDSILTSVEEEDIEMPAIAHTEKKRRIGFAV